MSELVSLIIPVHNEEKNLLWHHKNIVKFLESRSIQHELIYVNDGSTDNSQNIIETMALTDRSIRFINFSRNFGKEAATTAGLHHCSGDVAILIDADGQHPIELIEKFISRWKSGYDVVVGVRAKNKKEGIIKKYGSKLFYVMLTSFTDGNTVPGSTDFRLIDRKVIDEFKRLTEHNRITRGLVDWLGFKRSYVEFNAHERHDGKATYSFGKLMRLAIHAFVSHSTKPLQFTGFMGALVMVLSSTTGLFLLIETYVFDDVLGLAITGTAILALFLSFLIGLVLICQWLLALYIESIHSEAQNRPLYIVNGTNLDRKIP